jgi:hypothetical protein
MEISTASPYNVAFEKRNPMIPACMDASWGTVIRKRDAETTIEPPKWRAPLWKVASRSVLL